MSTHAQRRAARRRVLPGFPVEEPFHTPEELAAYFGGSYIVCLRCGKKYRKLGLHLLGVHEMDPDEYRKIYGIPWSYGLDCAETTEICAENMRNMIEDGTVVPPCDIYKKAITAARKPRQPVRDVLTARNLAKMRAAQRPRDPSVPRYQYDKRYAQRAHKGTPEFKEKMRNRPQTKAAVKMLRTYWIGREQTDEHVFKRTGGHKKSSNT